MDDPGPQFIRDLGQEQLEALIETMVLVAFSDGELSPPERARFADAVAMLTDGRLSSDSFAHIVERVGRRLEGEGIHSCLADLASRLPERSHREAALILASDMAAADGVLHPGEQRLLQNLATAFDLPSASTQEVTEGLTEPTAETTSASPGLDVP